MARGRIKVQCFLGDSEVPVPGSRVRITPSNGNSQARTNFRVDEVTDSSGTTRTIEVEAPSFQYSQNPSNNAPYSLYDIRVQRQGFQDVLIKNVQVFPERTAIQNVNLQQAPNNRATRAEVIVVLPNTLFGNYPIKIPENPEKPLPLPSSGVVLAQPVAPEFITVHQGSPNDSSAPNYKVKYKDYIKNVASSEIYSTWPESTIRANVYCIVSFTLNRIYTEWYRGKGKNFDITSSTAYDHAFNYGRNIYDSISAVVDSLFATYIKRYGRKQPLLTQYCDGKNVTCPQWLSQWGSKYLGDQGKVPYDILTYYYGGDIQLSRAQQVKGSPSSYPGYSLSIGSRGQPVRVVQEFLNRISQNYPLISKLAVDGIYGRGTADSVRKFQQTFNLPVTGVVDYATWYQISNIYVGVTKIAELRSDNIFYPPNSKTSFRSVDIPSFHYPTD